MADSRKDSGERDEDAAAQHRIPQSTEARPRKTRRKSLSMHDGIAVWCDCCSCEAEPYWVAVAEEMGIDLGSDYEEADPYKSGHDK
jgi:hypothetical protein